MILSNAAAIAAMDAVADLVDVGSGTSAIIFYDGTPPADADTALAGNTLLATVDLQDPAFGAAADVMPGARVTLLGVTLSDNSIDATGTCSFARLTDQDGTVILQLTVGTSSTDVIVNSTSFVMGATFNILSATLTMPES